MKKPIFALFLFLLIGKTVFGQTFYEDFETLDGIESTNYNGTELAFSTGTWYVEGITSMDASDRYNGERSVRLRRNSSDSNKEHRVEMRFDKLDGAGSVSFQYGSYGNHTGGQIKLYVSTDQGTTWQQKGDAITTYSWASAGSRMTEATIPVNVEGDIRVKIVKTNNKTNTSLNIDDIRITDYTGEDLVPEIVTDKTVLFFGSVETDTTSEPLALDISGVNLESQITYSLKENGGTVDVPRFSIDKPGWDSALGGTIFVIFQPTEDREYNIKLEIVSAGAPTVTVPISGRGYTPGSASSDATLTDLQIDGTSLMGFDPVTMVYSYVFPQGYTGIPSVTATATDANATVVFSAPQSSWENVSIEVIAEDGTSQIYMLYLRPYFEEPSDNHIADGGFESWRANGRPRSWYGSKTNTAIAKSLDSHQGEFAAELINTTSTQALFTTENAWVKNNYSYEINFFAKGHGSIRTGLYDGRPGDGFAPYNEEIVIHSDEWVRYVQEVKVEGVATDDLEAQFVFAVSDTDGLYLDDVFVSEYFHVSPTIITDVQSIDFGEAYIIDEESKEQQITITGRDLVNPIGYEIKGGNGAFTIEEGDDWAASTGGILHITFFPTTPEVYEATLELTSEGAYTAVVLLTGSGTEGSFEANLSDIQLDEVSISGFSSEVYIYRHMLAQGIAQLPVITATPVDSEARVTFDQPESTPATVNIEVVSPNGKVTKNYTLRIVDYFEESTGNYISNGGFEVWNSGKPTGWVGDETTGTYRQSEDSHWGFYSVELIRTQTNPFYFTTQNVALVEDHEYTISFYAKGVGKLKTGYFYMQDDNYNYITSSSTINVNSSAWQQYTLVLRPEVDATVAEFLFAFSETNGLYLDDVVITSTQFFRPQVITNKSSVDFGQVFIDESGTKQITVSTVDLHYGMTYSLDGDGKTDFAVLEESGWDPILGGKLSIVFTPESEKNYSVDLVIDQEEIESAVRVSLTAIGKTKSSDTTLSKLYVDGEEILDFDPSKQTVDIAVKNSYIGTPQITADANEEHASIHVDQATSVPGSASIAVTAHDGTVGIYYVNLIRSTDTGLVDIRIDNVSIPGFTAGATDYYYMLSEDYVGMPVVSIIPAAADYGATALFDQPLVVPTKIVIEITAADNVSKAFYNLYLVNYYQEPANNYIANGSFENWTEEKPEQWKGSQSSSDANIEKSTDTEWGFFALKVVNQGDETKNIATSAYSVQENILYQIKYKAKGSGELRVGLYNENEQNTYADFEDIETSDWTEYTQTIAANKTSDVAEFILSFARTGAEGLLIDNVFVRPTGETPEIVTDKSSLDFGQIYINDTSEGKTVLITGISLDENISYKLDGDDKDTFSVSEVEWNPLNGGTLSINFSPVEARVHSASLILESDEISTSVLLSGEGKSRRTNTQLKNIFIDGVAIAGFGASVKNYNYIVPLSYSGIPVVSAQTEDEDATKIITQATAIPGLATIAITAHDEIATEVYTVNFIRSSDATLANIKIDGQVISNFDPNTYLYYYVLSKDYTGGLPILTAELNDSQYGAMMQIEYFSRIPAKVKINTTAADGVTKRVYTVCIDNYWENWEANCIFNGGFEFWTETSAGIWLPDSWYGTYTSVGEAGTERYNTNPYVGDYSCELVNPMSSYKRLTTQKVSVESGQLYAISFYAKGKGDISTALYDNRSGGGFSEYNEYIQVRTDEWTKYTQYIKAESTTNLAEFVFGIRSTNGLYIDDVMIVKAEDVNIDDVNRSLIYAAVANNCISVYNLPPNSIVSVIDTHGSLLEKRRVDGSRTEFVVSAKGIYILLINSEDNLKTLKVINP